jgi:hypothetical protein
MLGKNILKSIGVASLAFMATSMPAFAGAASQSAEYWRDIVAILEVVIVGVAFIMGVGILVFSGAMFAKDYIFAKADHEKSFSIGKLIAGMVIGGAIAFPTAGILFGSDLLVQGEVDPTSETFTRPGDGG